MSHVALLASLARGCPPAVAARRHQLPHQTVLDVAYRHGWPNLAALEAAARAARGLPPVAEEPAPEPKPPRVPRGRIPADETCERIGHLMEAGWLRCQIADAAGIDRTTMSRIWRRQQQAVSWDHHEAITALWQSGDRPPTARPRRTKTVDAAPTRAALQRLVDGGMSLSEMSRETHVSRTALSLVLRGERRTVTPSTRDAIAALATRQEAA